MDFYLLKTEGTFFSKIHGIPANIDYMVGHKSYFHKSKWIEVVSTIFSDYDVLKTEVIINRTQKVTLTFGN